MHGLASDLRLAMRMLARRPGVSLLAILTLAVGIGATTAIFSVVDPVLFRGLPYPNADRIAMVWERGLDGQPSNTTFATYSDMVERNHWFSAIALVRDWRPTLMGRGEPEQIEGQRVSSTWLRVLGIHPALGRDFRAEEDSPSGERVVMVSQALWRRRFASDPSIIGKQISLDEIPHTVIGVLPADFENVLEPTAQIFAPLRYSAALSYACRSCRHLRAVARLANGVTRAQAVRDMNQLSAQLVQEHPTDYPVAGMFVTPLREQITRSVRPALIGTLAAVALLLVIACANVMSLLLARAVQREGEFAIRAALGAARPRVLRQLLAESLVLAAIGGACGVLVAHLALKLLVLLGPSDLPRLDEIRVDGRVLLFSLGITALTGIVSGLAPAFHAMRRDLQSSIRRAGRGSGRPARRTRQTLVVTEIALALVLLVAAGLLFRSLGRLLDVNPGVQTAHVLTMELTPTGKRFNNDTVTRAFFTETMRAVRAIPGVQRAALVSQLPLGGNMDRYGVHIESKPLANEEQAPSADRYAVSSDYLETMGIPVIHGRGLRPSDDENAPDVVVINETFAKRTWPGADPIGERVKVGGTDGPWRSIVGVVGDVHQESLDADLTEQVYLPEAQWPYADGAMELVVRTRGEPSAMSGAIRAAVQGTSRDAVITKVATMERVLAASTARRRFAMELFEAFAGVALLLAAAGIYGVLSGTVSERSREIGIRAALGATRRDILRLVVQQGLRLAATGIAIGAVVALAGMRLIRGLLYGVGASDPVTFVAVMALLFAVALAACWLPAWRAARLDPVMTLRSE
jgi:putative ABC transport system permease protein